jgi:hypothetical protein
MTLQPTESQFEIFRLENDFEAMKTKECFNSNCNKKASTKCGGCAYVSCKILYESMSSRGLETT